MEKDLKGKILDGKSYKLGKTPKGHMEVKFCIKEGDIYHNLKTHLEPGLDIPPYLNPGQEIAVSMAGAKKSEWEWNGKTYGDSTVHISMIRRGDMSPVGGVGAEQVGFPHAKEEIVRELVDPEDWDVNFEKLVRILDVYKPTQAGDLKEIARMAGF